MSIKTLNLFVAAALAVTPSLHAHETMMNASLRALPFESIAQVESTQGETIHTFLLRVAPLLATYTHKTGDEACGVIGKDPSTGLFSVVLGSSKSQIGCLAGRAGILPGYTWTGETIHSHPESRTLEMGPNDKAYAKATRTADPYAHSFFGSPNGFSRADFTGGPGYLVAGGELLYQNHPTEHPLIVGSVSINK